MAKSAGNYVGIAEPPTEMFGKVMSISDELMWSYYELLTDESVEQGEVLRSRVASGDVHPKQAKVDLAKQIVSDFHSPAAADAAAVEFDRVHTRGERPSEMLEVELSLGSSWKPLNRIMLDAGLASSASEATRKIGGRAVSINGAKVSDRHWTPEPGEYVIQVGRRFARLIVR